MADEKNKGGFLSGLGYLGQSLLAGIGNIGEGAIDAILAPLADLTGNHEFAESLFKKNWVGDWYADVTEDYNPGTGWEFAGNVAHGLGQSAYLFIPYAGASIFFSGVMAQGISSAAQQTGDVGIKEAAYGLTTGAVEGALEYVGGAAAKGAKTLFKSGAKSAVKSTVRKGLVKQVLSDAASEFTEEAMSEVIDVGLQRLYGINPNAELSLKDVLYAGAVGAVSGAVTTTAVQVPINMKNRARGEKIIKDGNSQTLVNTATSIADRIAAQGTDWDKAPEWAAAIRGQVDAYEKLSAGEKTGIRGQTLLGEMQSSLFFAEHQSVFNEVQKNIQNADEQSRATWAEYINKSVSKERRNNRDFTAEDVKNNTDNVAWQLAVYRYVPAMFNLDAAVVDLDTAQESGIGKVIDSAQNGMIDDSLENTRFDIDTELLNFYRDVSTMKDLNAKSKRKKNLGVISQSHADLISGIIQKETGKKMDLSGYELWIDGSAIQHIEERHGKNGAKDQSMQDEKDVSRITWVANNADKAEVLRRADGSLDVDYRWQNRDQSPSVKVKLSSQIDNSTFYVVECVPDSENRRLHVESAYIQKNSGKGQQLNIGSENPPQHTSETLIDSDATTNRISQNYPVVNPEAEKISSNKAIDEKGKNSRSEAIEVKGEQTSAETVQGETAGASPRPTGEFGGQGEVIDGATEGPSGTPVPTGEVDLERAKRDAERMIEWEKKNAPTAEELNTVREYVKGFDSLPADRQLAIVRMIRSSEGVDADTVRGVANLMAITNRKGAVLAPDLEFRFAELADGVAKRGIKTEVGGKTVIVLNTNSTYKNTIRGSIAHEIVHYLENRKGYKALADFAMKHAKAEKVAQVRETYKGVYKGENAEAKIEAEVVASVVAEMLNSEKFLKRYAQMGEEQGSVVKRIAKFVKGIANALKDKDDKASAVATDMMKLVDKALGSEVAREKTGTKYALPSKKDPTKLDPRTVTKEDVYEMLEAAKDGKYSNNTYIPVRISTPAIIIERAKEKLGINIPNHPLVMSVSKAINAMERQGTGDDGLPNSLEPTEIVSIIEATSNPLYVVYEPANEEHPEARYVEIVKFDLNNNRKAFAVLELTGQYKNAVHINGYESGQYNVFVTVYPPRSEKIKSLLTNKNNKIIYDKKKDFAQVTSDITVSSVLNDPSFFDNSIHQNESVVNPEAKEISSDDATDEKGDNSRSEAVEEKTEETGEETVQGETAGASPRPTGEFGGQGDVIDGATEGPSGTPVPTGEVDLERAKRDAERMIEWEKKNAPTAEELNRVREYVKNFDSLPADRQLAIVRMIRSSEGVDADTVRGVANLMAITNRKGEVLAPDLEFRFAEFGKDSTRRGIKTEVGGKTVIVLNANATYKDSIRGSIAHEIVHYLENRKGYKALADFAVKHAKAEKVAQVRETYKGVYKGENAEAKIEGEVVASVVAEMLGSEKFLKRYAQMGEEQGSVIKRIARFVKGIANALKDKDEEAGAVAADMMKLVDKALGSEVEGEKTGTKYALPSKKDPTKLDPRTVTKEDVRTMLEEAKKENSSYHNNTYIPLRVSTPAILIRSAEVKRGDIIDNNPIAISVGKAHQAMSEKTRNKTERPHKLSVDNMLSIIEAMNDPLYIVYQGSNGRYVEVVEYSTAEKKKAFAVMEIGEDKDSVYMNGYEGGLYNILVTTYPPDSGKLKELLDNRQNDVIYDKKKDNSQRTSGSMVPSVLNDSPFFIDSIHQNEPIVNTSDEKSSDKEQYDLDPEAVKKQKKKTTTKAEPKGIKTGSAEAGRFAVGLRKEFGLNKAAEDTIRSKLETLEEVFIKGDREAYIEEYRKKVEEIFDIVSREATFEVTTDKVYERFQTYMRGKRFRVDKQFRQSMGREEWNGVYSVIRGRLASDKNTAAPHVDSLYAELNDLFPDLFSSEIINVHDQLERIAKVMLDAKNAQSEEFDFSQLPDEWKGSVAIDVVDRINSFITRVSSNRDSLKIIKAEKNELLKMLKKERSLREKMAREEANAAKAERARIFAKKAVAPAVEEIEGLMDEQVRSLAKGYELEGMSVAQKERIISDIYIALHEASAEGEAGPGSVAVKGIATRIAWDMLQLARLKGENGKYYHLIDIYDEASMQAGASEYADVLYERFANMGEHTKNSYFAADLRATEEKFRRDRIDDNAIHKLSREVSYQGQQLRRLVETQKRGMEDEGIQKVTKILASVVDAKGNIVTSKVDEAIGEADRFFNMESGRLDSQSQAQEGTALTEFAYSSDANLKFMIDEFKRLRARVDKRGKDRTGKFLDAQEMRLLGKILAGMRKTVTEYNKVFINERYVDIDKVASDGATDIVEYYSLDKKAKTKVGELFDTLMRGIKQSYFYNVLTPETTIEALEGFKIGGVLKTLYHDVRIHKQKAEHLAVQMKKPFAEFLDAKGEIDIPVGRDVAGTDSVSDSDFDERSRIQKNVATFNSAEENTDVLNMISSVEAKKHNDNDKVYFENVSDDIAKIIHQLTGVDVKGFKVAIEARQLEHILNRHGKNGKQDQSLSDNSDIAKIESVLKHPDKIRRAGKTKAYSYTQDNKNKTADTVLYEMLLKDKSYYVVQAVPDTKSKTLYIVTAFMGEQGYESKITKGTPQLIDANAPTRTSENDFVVVPKNIIHQSKENVNKKISTIKVNPTWKDENGKKHSFRDKLNKKMINYNGAELTLGEAIYLYMLTKRELTHAGLKENGYIVYDENNQRRLKLKIEDVENVRNEIGNQLDDADKAFLKMAEEFFNKTSTEVKNEADMRIFGYTNIEDGYYVPMIRDRYARMQGVTDQRQSVGSIITVYNKSFNQNTVQNAKALEGKNIMSIINDHADGLADYSELYIPLKSFDRVYNKAVTVNGETRSIREILNDEVWNKTGSYLRDLFADIQGQNRKSDNVIDSMVGKLRSAWVNSVLGLNLKVVATQTTSFVAANQVIEAKYLMPAMKKFFGNQSELGARADKYSDIIEPRSFEMGALRAQGNIDKVMEWSSKTGFMINLMDRRVCLAVFHAAELKAQAQGAGAVGTVENAKAAAKIADEAIYTTQAMTSASERSALQRSKSEIARTLSMFTSDSVKNLSHFVGNVMKYQAHKARAKSDLASKAQYEAELKKDARAIRRSAKTLVMTGVMLGLITQAFKYLYAKEEEEPEEKAKDLATDVISSTFNILPGVSDIIDKFVFDYDLSLNVFDVANDTIEDTASLMNMAGRAMAGEYVSGDKVFKNVFNFVKTVGAAFGAPIAPVERTVTGLLRRFFPSAIYGYDAMMSNPSYSADLKAAVESGDEALAEHILETIYKNEATGVYSTPELEEVSALYQKGYTSVIPQKIGATVNDVTLDRKQRAQFESIYSQASAKVNELIRSEYYAELDDEQRAKAIKNLYSLYYNRAAAEVAGVEWSNAQAYSRLTNNLSALFAAQAYKSGLTPYNTLRGKEVSVKEQFVDYVENLRLSDADKLVVLYANGYRDAATKKKMLAYINALSISEDEKAKIAERLGFAVENGKVVEKKEELEVRER